MAESPVVVLPPLVNGQAESWAALIELAPAFGDNWLLVGGQMVFLHEVERQVTDVRPTDDVDLVVNLRAEPAGLERIHSVLANAGFDQDAPSPTVRVLRVEAEHEVSELGWCGWPSDSRSGWLGPVAGDESLMPPDDCRGLNDEHHTSESRPVESAREDREDGSVRRCELGTVDLALQHEDLMAKRQDLRVAFVTGHQQQPETSDQQSE